MLAALRLTKATGEASSSSSSNMARRIFVSPVTQLAADLPVLGELSSVDYHYMVA